MIMFLSVLVGDINDVQNIYILFGTTILQISGDENEADFFFFILESMLSQPLEFDLFSARYYFLTH